MTTPEDVELAKREAVRGDVVTVRWVCRHIIKQPSMFPGGRCFGPCGHVVVTTPTRFDFNAREARARCPSCGGMLTQRADGCELVSAPQSMMQAK